MTRAISKRIKIIIALAIFLIGGFLLFWFFGNTIKNFFYSFSSPIQNILWKKGSATAGFFNAIVNFNNLKKENEELGNKNKEMASQLTNIEEIKKENDTLRLALNMEVHKDFKSVLAQVNGKDIGEDTITIDKGSDDGVEPNMAAITAERVIVGKVSEVFKKYSKVILISNKKSSFDAEVSQREATGVLKGKGNFGIYLDLVPRDKNMSVGDIVITSNLSGMFPKGLIIGKISKIKKNDVESLQQAEIDPGYDIKTANYILLVVSK